MSVRGPIDPYQLARIVCKDKSRSEFISKESEQELLQSEELQFAIKFINSLYTCKDSCDTILDFLSTFEVALQDIDDMAAEATIKGTAKSQTPQEATSLEELVSLVYGDDPSNKKRILDLAASVPESIEAVVFIKKLKMNGVSKLDAATHIKKFKSLIQDIVKTARK